MTPNDTTHNPVEPQEERTQKYVLLKRVFEGLKRITLVARAMFNVQLDTMLERLDPILHSSTLHALVAVNLAAELTIVVQSPLKGLVRGRAAHWQELIIIQLASNATAES